MSFQIINLDVIKESMMGNTDLIKQLVEMFLIQSPIDFEALKDAIASGEHTTIKERAHHIKPTMQYIGANKLMSEFQKLENLAKEDASIEEIIASYQAIRPSFELMLEELKQLQ